MTSPLLSPAQAEFADAVRSGLARTPRELPSQYLYDAVGSALFEAITHLDEYGLTRADERLLSAHAGDLAGCIGPCPLVAELGSGSGRKTLPVLEALRERQPVAYFPIDVSPTALAVAERALQAAATVTPLALPYLDGLREVRERRPAQSPLLVLFLGSTLGNFSVRCASDFLRAVRALLRPGDWLLVGADLVKDVERMQLAYDDPAGVTAAFNRNLLARINRELGGTFDLRRFAHEARWNAGESRIEMHLRAAAPQDVTIKAIGTRVSFAAGDTIWTESSHKYTLPALDALAAESGFAPRERWVDRDWPFAECLWAAV